MRRALELLQQAEKRHGDSLPAGVAVSTHGWQTIFDTDEAIAYVNARTAAALERRGYVTIGPQSWHDYPAIRLTERGIEHGQTRQGRTSPPPRITRAESG
jgi:hypothetical protein